MLGLAFLAAQSVMAAVLTHRYSFDTDASDLVVSANGILQGAALVTNGALVLDGTNSSVTLPNKLLTNYDSVSFEVWFIDQGSDLDAVLYNFGGANGRISCTAIGQGSYTSNQVSQQASMPMPVPGMTNQLVWSQSHGSKNAGLYLNGVLMGRNTNFTLTPAYIGETTTNQIGASGIRSVLRGSILEFRIFDGALSPLEVAQHHAAGSDQPDLVPGDLQGLHLVVPSPVGPGALLSPGVFADYLDLTNVNIVGQPGLLLSSDNTNVIVIKTATNLLFPFLFSNPYAATGSYTNISLLTSSWKLQTVGTGSANITATFQGISNKVPVKVEVLQDAALIHRYSFDEPSGCRMAHDSLGGAHGRVIATTNSATFTGNGELSVGVGIANPSYVKLPPGIISSESEISVEAWLTYQGATLVGPWQGWERVFDFGDQLTGFGKTYFFMTPRNDSMLPRFVVSSNDIAGEKPILNWPGVFHSNVLYHVAATYSPARRVAKFYINGRSPVVGTATTPLAVINDINNWLGRSQFSQDPYLKARFDEFRIYRGLLQDSDIAADYAAGPDVVGVDYLLHYQVSSNSLAVTWGLSAADWSLQSTPVLGPRASWSQVTNTPTFQNVRYSITVPFSGDAAFFRLRSP